MKKYGRFPGGVTFSMDSVAIHYIDVPVELVKLYADSSAEVCNI